mmetsp:Transcript_10400/g.25444  ORF Transcript_10400/g.25444 Transcript_10400/m.25444 type:complete len:194 (-) Transcript_10400:278-859(-)|eukprot:CAMPEP_0114493836 /NCGR_PEP_ID=MMETSP0109-20121206/4322_1 /TAXON_ID=29199 /ORGANISM="Chlorarachnion reptans, Strain CCCM449" /LENGTH=193 /DNA_ID=CAMNT_0001670815 /DNA_START=210 /DNA_END=791 /DNA_ORIENTATION=-
MEKKKIGSRSYFPRYTDKKALGVGHLDKGRKVSELTQEQLDEIKEAFMLFDTNHTGTINVRELRAAMRALGFQVKKEELKEMLDGIDKNGNSEINMEEFIKLMSGKMGLRDTKEEILKVFQLFDVDNSGYITLKNLRRIVNELGEQLSEQDLQEMIEEADRDQDGQISPDEFYRVMKKRSNNPLDDWSDDEEY